MTMRVKLNPVTSWSWESQDGSEYVELSNGCYHDYYRVGDRMEKLGVYPVLSDAEMALADEAR